VFHTSAQRKASPGIENKAFGANLARAPGEAICASIDVIRCPADGDHVKLQGLSNPEDQ
jgi:hypothetical protein